MNDTLITLQGFKTEDSYNFKVVVTDTLLSRIQEERFISTIKVLLDFRAGGKGLGIGKIAEYNFNIYFTIVICISFYCKR